MTNAVEDPKPLGRMSAVAETALLLVVGSLVAGKLAAWLAMPSRQIRDALLYAADGPNWAEAAQAEAQWLALRYGLTLVVALLIAWWVGGPTRRAAGLSRGGRSLLNLVGFGFVMGLLLNAPVLVGQWLHQTLGVGGDTPFWSLMRVSVWTPAFWMFMAASSFGIVPVVEELFFRAYALGRYRMHFSAGGAILLSAVFFWVSHGQYLQPDGFLLFNSALTFIFATVLAWSVVRTGSILPSLIAHMIVNVPLTPPLMLGAIAIAAMITVTLRAGIWRNLVDFVRTLAGLREPIFLLGTLGVFAGAVLLIRLYPQALLPVIGLFVLAVLVGLVRRSPWRRRQREAAVSH